MKAFTLIELIFVIVLMGILTFIGFSFLPDNTLNDDTKALKNLINLKITNALSYEANMSDENDKKRVCITFDKNYLNNEENSSRIKYFFKADINSTVSTVCFDKFGRPFENNVDGEDQNLLDENVIITLKYKNKEKNITIHKQTGYVE